MGSNGNRLSLAHRAGELVADIDPAGLRTAAALKAIAGTTAVVLLTIAFARAIPHLDLPAALGTGAFAEAFEAAKTAPDLILHLPMVGAILALNFFLLIPAGSYGAELRRFAIVAGLSLAIVSAVGLAGPGAWGAGQVPVALLWILLIMVGLYARRWGPVAAKLGILTALLGIVFVITNPTPELGFWFPAVAAIAITTAGAIRFLTLRPSAVRAFRVQGERFLEEIATELDAIGAGTTGGPGGAFTEAAAGAVDSPIRRRWLSLQRTLSAATNENTRLAPRLTAQLVAAYRIVLAYDVVRDAIGAMTPSDRDRLLADPRLRHALDRLSNRLLHPAIIAFPSGDVLDPELSALLDDLVDAPDPIDNARLQEVRLAIGVRRIERSLNDFLAGRSQVEMAALPPASGPTSAADTDTAARAAGRLAVQALVATGITTALQFAFQLDHAYWATLTVALVLNGTVGATLVRTVKRGIGTLVGVVAAIALVPLIGTEPALEVTLMLVAIFVVTFTVDRYYLIASAAIGFAVALAIHLLGGATPGQMAARAYETFIGAGVALAVAWLLFPKFASADVGERVAAFLEQVRAGFARATARSASSKETMSAPLADELQALADDIPSIAAERRLLGRSADELGTLVILLDALVAYLGQYEGSSGNFDRTKLPAPIRDRLAELDRRLAAAMEQLIAIARARPARGVPARPVLFEVTGVTTTEILEFDPPIPSTTLLPVVDHAFSGNRIGRTINDLAAALTRLDRA